MRSKATELSLTSSRWPETLVLYRMRSIVEVRRRALRWERVRYSGLKEAAFVRGGRYGISIDFGLEIVGKKSTCGASFKSKFTDPTMEAKLGSPHRNPRQTILQGSWSRISDAVRFEHATASAAKRLRSNALLGSTELFLSGGVKGRDYE